MTRFFIGADNRTHEISRDYLEQIEAEARSVASGFTIYRSTGYWEDTKEDSVILEIGGIDRESSLTLANKLKERLGQEAIGVQFLPEINFI